MYLLFNDVTAQIHSGTYFMTVILVYNRFQQNNTFSSLVLENLYSELLIYLPS
jgi:hypothetical protein